MRAFMLLCVISFLILVIENAFCIVDSNMQVAAQCGGHATATVTFQTNLKTLMNSLASQVVKYHGFHAMVVGEEPNKVYGSILCRGDISTNDCSNCAFNATTTILDSCPQTATEAAIWYRWCFLQYSNETLVGQVKSSYVVITNGTDLMVPAGIPFMDGVANAASEQPNMFQLKVSDISGNEKRYGMAQCKRDISKVDCKNCLEDQLAKNENQIANKSRWEIYGYTCFMWYYIID